MACRGGCLRSGAAAVGLGLMAMTAGPATGAQPELCLSWPGEPLPLPQVNDADPARARWAELRAVELAREAVLAEESAAVASQRRWTRVLCLDPGYPGARQGLERTHSVRVHRPELRWGTPPRRPAGARLATLSDPVRVRRAPSAPEAEPPSLVRARELITAAEKSLAGARFSEALGRALTAREELDAGPANATARALKLRVEVIAATAQVALGDEAGARESFVRALTLDPALALDPAATSPKVLAALEAARAEAGSR